MLDNESDPQAMMRYLREIDNRFDTIFSFFIYDKIKRYYDPQRILKTMSESVQEVQWYFQARELSDEHPYLIDVGHDPEKSTASISLSITRSKTTTVILSALLASVFWLKRSNI